MAQMPNLALFEKKRITGYKTNFSSHGRFCWSYKSATLFFKYCPVLPASFSLWPEQMLFTFKGTQE
jgi:hypothetical protein